MLGHIDHDAAADHWRNLVGAEFLQTGDVDEINRLVAVVVDTGFTQMAQAIKLRASTEP